MPKVTFFNLTQEKRRFIERAALAEFAEYGAKGASLNRLVRAAGIAKGSFYQYFDDMEDVLKYLVLQLGERKVAIIQQALAECTTLIFTTNIARSVVHQSAFIPN